MLLLPLIVLIAVVSTTSSSRCPRRVEYTPVEAVANHAACKYFVEYDDNAERIPKVIAHVSCSSEESNCGKDYKCTQLYTELEVGWLEGDKITEKNKLRVKYGCVCALDKWESITPVPQPDLQAKKRGKPPGP